MAVDWFHLLEQYRRDGHFGLTPSFLVGALRIPRGEVSDEATGLAELKALLSSMRDDTPPGFHVRIAQCPRLRQAVAAILPGAPRDGDGSLGNPVSGPPDGAARLYAWPQYFIGSSRDLEALTSGLWATFGIPIREGRFSYRDGGFHPFSAADLDFIQRTLENRDDAY